MTQPLDAIVAIHNAFRSDIKMIDAAAVEAARGQTGLAPTIERFQFLNEILVWHAAGEEQVVFPALETVAPSVAEAYVMDHHGLDAAYTALNAAVSADDTLQTACAAAAFKFHLDIHLKKEDTHLYRLFGERIPMPEQGKVMGQMAGTVPQERFPEVIAWMFPLLGTNDRENMIRIWQTVMPAPVFAGVKPLIRKAIGDDWAEMERRIPALSEG
jgi:hemerythrin-like domain-containing protein